VFGPPTPITLPLHPFTDNKNLNATSPVAIGPGYTRFGVTSITFSNNSQTVAQVDIFQASTNAAKCAGTVSNVIGNNPDTFVIVPANATIQVLYPTPLVINFLNSQSCLGFGAVGTLTNGVISALVVGQLHD
jgi:hypothetical protein